MIRKFFKKLKSLFWGDEKSKNRSPLFLLLITLSTVALVVSNIVAQKSFSLGFNVGGAPAVLTCGVLCFPITYILSDLFSECYGFSASRRATWLGFAANIFVIGIVMIAIVIPAGNPYYQGISNALKSAFGFDFLDGGKNLGSLGILIASLLAFVIGSWVDDLVFEKLRVVASKNDSTGKFVFRAVGSSLAGEIVDSLIFIPLLYVFTQQMGSTITNVGQLLAIVGIQAAIKTAYELCVSPLTAQVAKKIKLYESSREKRIRSNIIKSYRRKLKK